MQENLNSSIISLAAARSVRNLLLDSNFLFVIKPPQRRYKWGSAEITQFWTDIVSAFENDPDYFFGSILLVHQQTEGGSTTYLVIDGQQRLTTIGLCLAALRDECDTLGSSWATGLHGLIVRLDLAQQIEHYILTPQEPDAENYKIRVGERGSTNNPPQPINKESDLVAPGLETIKRLISAYLSRATNRLITLESLVSYITSKVTLLPIDVGTEDRGHLIFDTSNTRGKTLSQSEKVRAGFAHNFRSLPALRNRLDLHWIHAGMSLENKKLPIDSMDRYLHVVWSAYKGYQALNNLSVNINKLKSDSIDPTPEQFVESVRDYAEPYTVIIKPEETNIEANLKGGLLDLRRLGFSQANGFLTMVYKHENQLFETALNAVLSLQVRNITIGRVNQAHDYQNDWPNWSIYARQGRTSDAIAEIQKKLLSDDTFKQRFIDAPELDSGSIYHVIRKLDLTMNPNSGVSLQSCEVEHIVPQSVRTQLLKGYGELSQNVKMWIADLGQTLPTSVTQKRELGEQLKSYIGQIGNQILWHKILNRQGGNRRFSDKRQSYQLMAIKMTEEIGLKTEWNLSDITERQHDLADWALRAWPSQF